MKNKFIKLLGAVTDASIDLSTFLTVAALIAIPLSGVLALTHDKLNKTSNNRRR
jgi:hypothetical protein